MYISKHKNLNNFRNGVITCTKEGFRIGDINKFPFNITSE